MHYGAMLVGQFLKAAEFGTGETPAQPTYTIARVVIEKLESIAMNDMDGGTAKLKNKGVIYFREVDRGWVINRTNAECLAAMFGIDTDAWVNKRITLFAADVRVGAKMDIGIRIKGSPDMAKEITVMVKLPRRKPTPMKLIPTGTTADNAFAACNTVDDLKAAWSKVSATGGDLEAAKVAYKARLEQVKHQPHADIPPPDQE